MFLILIKDADDILWMSWLGRFLVQLLTIIICDQDETGVYKNLLQEIAQRVGAPLPQYTTFRSGLGHLPVFTGIVELAGITFTGEPAKNKKQAEKNAAMAAWSALKQCELYMYIVHVYIIYNRYHHYCPD